MKATLLELLIFLLPVQWSLLAQNVADENAKISGIYVNQSRVALQENELPTAGTLLSIAIEFDPRNSDAYYLRGEMCGMKGNNIPQAISSFRSALDYSNWNQFSEETCVLKLAPLLVRTKRYSEALRVLRTIGSTSADGLYYVAESLEGTGRNFQARNLLAQAAQAYPNDLRFPVLRARIDPIYRESLVSNYLSSPSTTAVRKEVLESVIANLQNESEKRKLIELYDKRFPRSPVVFGQSLLVSLGITTADIDKYASNGLLSNAKLVKELYSKLPAGSIRDYLVSKMKSYTGKVWLDTNGDGIPEEIADYTSGTLTTLSVDTDQDGGPEYTVRFNDGKPRTVKLVLSGVNFTLTYSQYPFVTAATSVSTNVTTTYILEPKGVMFPLFGAGTTVPAIPAAFPPIVRAPVTLSRQQLFAFASEVRETRGVNDEPVSLWEKGIDDILILQKEWEKGRYAYRAFYHSGQKFAAEIDLDNDGHYEVHEYYRDGKLVKITYDPNHKRNPEFTLVLDPCPILSWDYNQDGLIDEIEKRVAPNETILEFSTKMNGTVDVITNEVNK